MHVGESVPASQTGRMVLSPDSIMSTLTWGTAGSCGFAAVTQVSVLRMVWHGRAGGQGGQPDHERTAGPDRMPAGACLGVQVGLPSRPEEQHRPQLSAGAAGGAALSGDVIP